jgi:hypothetical protein
MAGGLALTPNTNPGIWGTDATGSAYYATASASGASIAAPPWLQLTGPLTMVLQVTGSTFGPINGVPMFGITYTNTSTSPFAACYVAYSSAAFHWNFNYGGASFSLGTGVAIGANTVPRWLGFTYASGAQAAYVTNPWTPIATASNVGNITYGASPLLFVGCPPYQASHSGAYFDYAFIFNRVLAPQELAAIQGNPWQIFAPQWPQWLLQPAAQSRGILAYPWRRRPQPYYID